MDISLRQRLAQLGWDDRYLGNDGYYARLGMRNQKTCLVPFSPWQRWLTPRALSLEEIIPVGTRIRFLRSLMHDIVGEQLFLSPSWFLVRLMSLAASADLRKM